MMDIIKQPDEALGNDRSPKDGSRGQAMTEALSLFVVFMVLVELIETSWLGALQLRLVGWNFLAYALMGLLAFISILASGRSISDLGLDPGQLRDRQIRRAVNVVVAELALIWVLGILAPGLIKGLKPSFILPPSFFANANNWPTPLANLVGWTITIAFTTAFYGIGQELFYRGCIQGSLNRALGRPFKIAGTEFGFGFIIATVLFTIGQGLFIYSPLVSEPSTFEFGLGVIIILVEGIVLGLLYERTNGVLASMTLHAVIGFFFFGIEMVR